MEETSDLIKIEDLKRRLVARIIISNFNLQHPQVVQLSCELNTLMVPIFRAQLPKAKIIQFPIK